MKKRTRRIIITSAVCALLLAIISVIAIRLSYYTFSFMTSDGTAISGDSVVEVPLHSEAAPRVMAMYRDMRSHKDGVVADISMKGTIDLDHLGEYVVTYTATYEGKSKSIDVTIKVADVTAPVISLVGGSEIYWPLGDEYIDPGYNAIDDVDGDITSDVGIDGDVDIEVEGEYTLTYRVKDSSGNEGTATRQVVVKDIPDGQVIDPGDKVVYLTFDDGPGPYTARLLDILDRYGVKVTFFTTDAYPGYEDLLAEEVRRGHTVAIHTFSHRYNDVYASDDAYFADFYAMRDLIVEKTGREPWLVRFPGGSSNMVSAKYSPGMMTRLTAEVTNRGYKYVDWNVASGDAGETKSSDQVYTNVITGMAGHRISTVLQHDVKDYSVDAVARIIEYGLSHGYKFLPLTETSPMEHHAILN